MRVGMIPLLAQDCLSRQPPPADEDVFLLWVAQKAVREGVLSNRGGYDAMHLAQNFSKDQREEILAIYREFIQGDPSRDDSPPLPQGSGKVPDDPRPLPSSSLNGLYLFLFGIVFIVTLIVLAIFFPEPSPFQHLVFRIVLGLAAAGIAASMPGALDIKIEPGVKAGGAIAVFIVVYLLSPAQLVTKPPGESKASTTQSEPTEQAAPDLVPSAERTSP